MIQKEELKYPIGGYAPGNYICNCSICKKQFQGDKRAVQCEPCAVKMSTGLKQPHLFCETPEENCSMNYCDENGCQNRNRFLVEEPKQETLEHTSKFIVFTLQDYESWIQHSIPLDSFEKADNFCQQFRDRKVSYLICKTLKQGYNGK